MTKKSLDTTRVSLIELFTRKKDVVFDPHSQDGTTLDASLYTEREFIGITDTEQQAVDTMRNIEPSHWDWPNHLFNREFIGDILTHTDFNMADLLLTEMQVCDFDSKVSYQHNVDEYVKQIKNYLKKLKSGKYLALIVADQRHGERYYCRHADVIHALQSKNLILQGVINVIRDSQALKAYGYPSTYVPNIINQFVLIFKKA